MELQFSQCYRNLIAIYNRFGIKAKYNNKDILIVRDIDLKFEHNLHEMIKVKASDIALTLDENDIFQLPEKTIFFENKIHKIISFEFIGNMKEEIGLIIEGNRR